MQKVYGCVNWFAKRAHILFLLIVALFVAVVFQLRLVTNQTLAECFLETLYVFMGDAPSLVQPGNLPNYLDKAVFAELTVVRFAGWMILPLVVGFIFAAAEHAAYERHRIQFEDEGNVLKVLEKGDDLLYQELTSSGISPEQAQKIIRQDRDEFLNKIALNPKSSGR